MFTRRCFVAGNAESYSSTNAILRAGVARLRADYHHHVHRVDLINAIAPTTRPFRYLEIGLRGGATYWAVEAHTKVGVDPAFLGRRLAAHAAVTKAKLRLGIRRGPFVLKETSDQFFDSAERFRSRTRFDCVLVDGLHTYQQAYRDVCNATKRLAPGGVVIMHDCNPLSRTAGLSQRSDAIEQRDYTNVWNGDVWKAVVRLRTRADLCVQVLDCDHGLGIVRHGEPDSRLDLDQATIEDMSYDDLAADRTGLLNLVDEVSGFDAITGSRRT